MRCSRAELADNQQHPALRQRLRRKRHRAELPESSVHGGNATAWAKQALVQKKDWIPDLIGASSAA